MGFKRDEAWISLWGVFASAGGCRNWIQHIATDSYPAPFFLPLVFLSFFCNSTLGPSSILTVACLLSLPLHLSRLQHIKYLSIMCLSIMFISASQFPFLVLNFTFFQSHWMYQEGLCAWECGRPQRPREDIKLPGVATSCPTCAFGIAFWSSTVALHHWASRLHLLSPFLC